MRKKKSFAILHDLYCRFLDDEIPALGAQITYSWILSFFPFLIFLLTLIGYTPVTSDQVLSDLAQFLPTETYEAVRDIIDQTLVTRSGLSLVIFIVFTLHIASNGVLAIMRGINKAYDLEEKRSWFKLKGIATLFIMALAILIILSFIMLVFGKVLETYLINYFGLSDHAYNLWEIGRYLIPLSGMILVFASLYSYTPSTRIPPREALPGAVFSTLGWSALSIAFAYYVNHFANFSPIYGSLGGIIALLFWLYWSSVVILMGGELNATLSFSRKGILKPQCKMFGMDFPLFKRNRKHS